MFRRLFWFLFLIEIVYLCKMGNFVSNNSFYLLLKRGSTRYNAENRAYKELSRQEKSPVAAPKYDAGIVDYRKSMLGRSYEFRCITLTFLWYWYCWNQISENKTYLAEVTNKNTQLNERLKDVYVTSSEEEADILNKNKLYEKLLPMKRTTDFFELGYKESNCIPVGRVSLMQTMKFISDHRMNASVWTVDKIANETKLKKDVVGRILVKFWTPLLYDVIDCFNFRWYSQVLSCIRSFYSGTNKQKCDCPTAAKKSIIARHQK